MTNQELLNGIFESTIKAFTTPVGEHFFNREDAPVLSKREIVVFDEFWYGVGSSFFGELRIEVSVSESNLNSLSGFLLDIYTPVAVALGCEMKLKDINVASDSAKCLLTFEREF